MDTNDKNGAGQDVPSIDWLDVSLGHFLNAKIELIKAARALIESPLPAESTVEEMKTVIGDLCVTIEILQTSNANHEAEEPKEKL